MSDTGDKTNPTQTMNKTTVIEDMGQSERRRAARNALELTEAEISKIEQTEIGTGTGTGTGETGA